MGRNILLHSSTYVECPVMNPDNPIVFVVDDDYRVREALSSLIASVDFE